MWQYVFNDRYKSKGARQNELWNHFSKSPTARIAETIETNQTQITTDFMEALVTMLTYANEYIKDHIFELGRKI